MTMSVDLNKPPVAVALSARALIRSRLFGPLAEELDGLADSTFVGAASEGADSMRPHNMNIIQRRRRF